MGELNFWISGLVEEVEMVRKEAEAADGEIEKRYITNFHLTEAYQSFGAYW